jgi:hypothetical protein
MKVFWLVIALILLGVLYLLYVALQSYFLVRGAPREDMFICQKGHGPLPKSALINFMGEEYCSICFHQNMKKAEKGML